MSSVDRTGDISMEAIVVYDSVWGNTKTVAAAIAQGLGPDVRAFATDTVPLERLATADLIVADASIAPVMA
jgi:flavodoxin